MAPRGSKQLGFTLVELLVVIGIVALLISMLLPALNRARASARTVECLANLRSILQGMQIYAAQNKGFFPGGANSSGAFLVRSGAFDDNNCPDISQIWDWQAPIARMLAFPFDPGRALAQRTSRFTLLIEHKTFRCPENDILATPYTGGPTFPTTFLNSYNTAAVFHYRNNPGAAAKPGDVGKTLARSEYNVRDGYSPQLASIGDGSRKIFIADGARFTTCTTPPDMDLTFDGGFGGAFSDVGAWSAYSRSWDRGLAPGNNAPGIGSPGTDARIYAYRHGTRRPGSVADAFRFNAGFFDGHAQTLGDLEGADPALWTPRGTKITWRGEVYPDVAQRYFKNASDPWFSP